MTQPAVRPADVATRTARSGNGHRVYAGGDLLGYTERWRTTGTNGRECTRWRIRVSPMAFQAPGRPLTTGVPERLYRPGGREWLRGDLNSKEAAIAALVRYLIENQAPALGYPAHQDVAAAPHSPRAAT